jgi:hypothetical protein
MWNKIGRVKKTIIAWEGRKQIYSQSFFFSFCSGLFPLVYICHPITGFVIVVYFVYVCVFVRMVRILIQFVWISNKIIFTQFNLSRNAEICYFKLVTSTRDHHKFSYLILYALIRRQKQSNFVRCDYSESTVSWSSLSSTLLPLHCSIPASHYFNLLDFHKSVPSGCSYVCSVHEYVKRPEGYLSLKSLILLVQITNCPIDTPHLQSRVTQ